MMIEFLHEQLAKDTACVFKLQWQFIKMLCANQKSMKIL